MPAEIRSEPVEIRIVEAEIEKKPQPRQVPAADRAGGGKDRKGGGEDAPTHGLPKCILLTKEGRAVEGYAYEAWPEGFDENDGGMVDDLGDGEVVYKISYDNTYHLNYRIAQRGIVARDVVTEKYILGMRILLLGYERALRLARSDSGTAMNGIGEYADDFRRMAARGAASTVLALAENLPKIVDKSSVEEDVE
jgi:hypothetical protein